MAALSSWYNSQYSTWNRTRRLHQTPYLARTETNASRRATAMAQEAVVINMGDAQSSENKDKKKHDTLFGPNIGIVSGGPTWTERHEKSMDELTPEVVKGWIAKSKGTNPSTTTLQALVNLKRPTLRLSPLEISPTDDPDLVDSQHHYGLEFEYDCDSPKCGIYVHVVLSPSHHLANKSGSPGYTKLLVFESVIEGGFGKILKLEEGAMLELGRFDHRSSPAAAASSQSLTEDITPLSGSVVPDAPAAGDATPSAPGDTRRKRFTHFHFRKRDVDRSVAGPALAVVDAEANTNVAEDDKPKEEKEDEANVGVKVTIRLAALDEAGKELPWINEQTTYLHIVRFGAPPTAIEGAAVEEDKRPWVVKVVKREATIGPHTFHLHEIYGLSANSTTSKSTQPVAPPPTTHSYPPTNAAVPPVMHEEELSSECLLCLSSPREVVLLPCRHLVACRECAMNMIEFGAGGTIVHADSEIVPPSAAPEAAAASSGEGAGAGEGNSEGTSGPAGTQASALQPPAPMVPAVPPTPTANPRRKRKAKGWFCPVCRQPYTSLLRITTTPPAKDVMDDDQRESTDSVEHPLAVPPPTMPAPAAPAPTSRFTRPSFLRPFSRHQPSDIERGQPGAVAA